MRRAQATIELLVLIGLALALALVVAVAARGEAGRAARHLADSVPGHRPERRDDRWALRSDAYGALIRRYAPTLVLERDRYGQDDAVPSDPAVCRASWCAAVGTGLPTLFVHRVRRPGVTYLEYWLYYPDSRTTHAPLGALAGYHRDDWEGVIVRIPDGGRPGARVTAHLSVVGARAPWLGGAGTLVGGDPGWQPVGPHPVVYRAAGSHANGFRPTGIDLALDRWNGALATIPAAAFRLVAADTAPALRLRYDPAASPPWRKALWRDPEATGTGAPSASVREVG